MRVRYFDSSALSNATLKRLFKSAGDGYVLFMYFPIAIELEPLLKSPNSCIALAIMIEYVGLVLRVTEAGFFFVFFLIGDFDLVFDAARLTGDLEVFFTLAFFW